MVIDAERLTHRSASLDTLRFICALWVLLAHLVSWTVFIDGSSTVPSVLFEGMRGLQMIFQPAFETHPAVLIFIVLSGYCVHRNGFRQHRFQGAIPAYAVRRMFRIYPVFLLATIVGVACFWISHSIDMNLTRLLSGTDEQSAALVAAKIIGLSAIFPELNQATYQGNAPLHTIMAEIWLYAAYPIIFYSMTRFREAFVWLGIVALTVVGVIAVSMEPGLKNWWQNGSFFGFLIYWWIGAASVGDFDRQRSGGFLFAIGLGWLTLSLILIAGFTDTIFIVELRKICFAILIAALIRHLDRSGWLSWRIGAWLGKAGYSLYAFHAPLVYALLIAGLAWFIVGPLVILAGIFFFSVYERPLDGFGRKLSEKIQEAKAARQLHS